MERYRQEQGYPWPVAKTDTRTLRKLGVMQVSTKIAVDDQGVITYRAGHGGGNPQTWRAVFRRAFFLAAFRRAGFLRVVFLRPAFLTVRFLAVFFLAAFFFVARFFFAIGRTPVYGVASEQQAYYKRGGGTTATVNLYPYRT